MLLFPSKIQVHGIDVTLGFLFLVSCMEDGKKERWLELCLEASAEKDSAKLLQIVQEIDRILQEKEERRKGRRPVQED